MMRIRAVAVLVLTAVLVTLSPEGASAGRTDPPGHRTANHCFNDYGVDYNEIYGISDQFRSRTCQELTAGEHWIRPQWWITYFEEGAVYPAGYTPSRPAPMDDFLAKLTAIKVVVDPGTKQQRTYTFNGPATTRTDINAEQLEPGGWGAPYPMASMLPRLKPLSAGDHFVESYLVFSAQHCDGWTTDPDWSCLPAGDVLWAAHPLTVTPPTH